MSAFIVSQLHINTIVSWAAEHEVYIEDPRAKRGTRYCYVGECPQEVAETLYAENVRSVNHRYSERTKTTGHAFERVDTSDMSPAAIGKLIDCLDYQSCERKQWARSRARDILLRIQSKIIGRLPGYYGAPWSI